MALNHLPILEYQLSMVWKQLFASILPARLSAGLLKVQQSHSQPHLGHKRSYRSVDNTRSCFITRASLCQQSSPQGDSSMDAVLQAVFITGHSPYGSMRAHQTRHDCTKRTILLNTLSIIQFAITRAQSMTRTTDSPQCCGRCRKRRRLLALATAYLMKPGACASIKAQRLASCMQMQRPDQLWHQFAARSVYDATRTVSRCSQCRRQWVFGHPKPFYTSPS